MGFFDVHGEAALDHHAAAENVEGQEFIFDVQGHYVNPEGDWLGRIPESARPYAQMEKASCEANSSDADRISKRTLHEQGHVWVPDDRMLVIQLARAGFRDVKVVRYGISEHAELNGIELMDGIREYESLCVEGIK